MEMLQTEYETLLSEKKKEVDERDQAILHWREK